MTASGARLGRISGVDQGENARRLDACALLYRATIRTDGRSRWTRVRSRCIIA
jgi:hypothetical protein